MGIGLKTMLVLGNADGIINFSSGFAMKSLLVCLDFLSIVNILLPFVPGDLATDKVTLGY